MALWIEVNMGSANGLLGATNTSQGISSGNIPNYHEIYLEIMVLK